jgi:hypothetical protein
MAFARMYDNPNLKQEQYDGMVAKMRVAESPPDGALLHFAGPTADGGWRVIEVWESEGQAQAWDDKLNPALEAAGIVRPAPEIWPVHNLIVP